MRSINDKVTVIIRSVGERTEQLCQELILAQGVDLDNVVTVRETPFSAAMRKSFETGLERGLPWTFCVDADLLLRPGSVEMMVQLAEQQKENVCEIQGYVLDKFFGGPRNGGVHLYRTGLLDRVISQIPREGVDIRPEFHTLKAMKAQGYPWVDVPYLIGLHDFEQYYGDIFRKCFVQAHKYQYLTELFLSIWRERATYDMDYRIALKGFAKGIEHFGGVFIDTSQTVYQQSFTELQIEEKNDDLTEYSLDKIEQIITQWVEPELYQKKFPTKMGLVSPENRLSFANERIRIKTRELGPIKMLIYAIGWLLIKMGRLFLAWIKPST
jgi:hypothetical protein